MHETDWTVVVPVCRRADFLEQSLGEVCRQHRNTNAEILVPDNSGGTMADAVDAVGRYRVRYYSNPGNLGTFGSVNQAIHISFGRLIHWLCDDDYVEPGFYEAMEEAAKRHPDADVFVGRYRVLQPGGSFWESPIHDGLPEVPDAGWMLRQLATMNPFQQTVITFTRRAWAKVGPYQGQHRYCADWLWTVKAAMKGCKFVHVPEARGVFRQHEDSTTAEISKSSGICREMREAYDDLRKWLPLPVLCDVAHAWRTVEIKGEGRVIV
jgi:GT2 family glycosyltransferase